jgi:hypothetical protein
MRGQLAGAGRSHYRASRSSWILPTGHSGQECECANRLAGTEASSTVTFHKAAYTIALGAANTVVLQRLAADLKGLAGRPARSREASASRPGPGPSAVQPTGLSGGRGARLSLQASAGSAASRNGSGGSERVCSLAKESTPQGGIVPAGSVERAAAAAESGQEQMRGVVVTAGLQILVGKSFRGLTLAQPKPIAGTTRMTKACHQRCGQAVERVHGQSLCFLGISPKEQGTPRRTMGLCRSPHTRDRPWCIGALMRSSARRAGSCGGQGIQHEKRAGHQGPAKRMIREAKRLGDGRAASPACSRPAASSATAAAEGAGRRPHDRPEPRSCCTAAFSAPAPAWPDAPPPGPRPCARPSAQGLESRRLLG